MKRSRSETRRERLSNPNDYPWLAERLRATVDVARYREAGLPNPVVAGRYLGDLAAELGAVSLSGGTIGDMVPPDFVRDAARDAVDSYPHYPGVGGYRDLRQAIAAKLERDNEILADPEEELLPAIGCQQVIDFTCRILIDPGDEVLVFDPEYASTEPAVHLSGGRVVPVPLHWNGRDWRFDIGALERRASARSKLLIISNPSNPTGIVYRRSELEAIAELARDHDFWVFADEEYEKTLFDGVDHTSIAALPGMKERTVTGFSFSKPYAMTPYRIGYVVGPAPFIDHFHSLLRFSVQACPAVAMRAAYATLTGEMGPWLEASTANLQAKRDELVERLEALPGITCNRPQGVYFVFPDVRGLGLTSFELARHLLLQGRVAVAPGSSFGEAGEGHLRISFCPALETIREGMTRFEAALPG